MRTSRVCPARSGYSYVTLKDRAQRFLNLALHRARFPGLELGAAKVRAVVRNSRGHSLISRCDQSRIK
jgi:hypothetical protein